MNVSHYLLNLLILFLLYIKFFTLRIQTLRHWPKVKKIALVIFRSKVLKRFLIILANFFYILFIFKRTVFFALVQWYICLLCFNLFSNTPVILYSFSFAPLTVIIFLLWLFYFMIIAAVKPIYPHLYLNLIFTFIVIFISFTLVSSFLVDPLGSVLKKL